MDDRSISIFDFDGRTVRTVTINGEPWFVARDVAATLGYADPVNAIKQHAKGVANHHPLQTAGGIQQTRIISEPDVLRLIMNSRLPSAERFELWVFEEVLPAIRRTGSYSLAPALDISTPQGILALAEMAADTARKLITATAQVQELTPRAEAWDELASAEGDFEVADAAKILARAGVNTGRTRLFSQLADMTWIYRGNSGKWTAYQSAVSAGYLAERPQSHHHPRTGELVLDPPQVRVTAKGLERLRVRLGTLDTSTPILTAVNA